MPQWRRQFAPLGRVCGDLREFSMLTQVLALPGIQQNRGRAIGIAAIFAVITVTLFIDTEILAVTAAALWAMSGLFAIPAIFLAVLGVAVSIPALWACIAVAILVFNAETDPANN
jgi:hypothetical protein